MNAQTTSLLSSQPQSAAQNVFRVERNTQPPFWKRRLFRVKLKLKQDVDAQFMSGNHPWNSAVTSVALSEAVTPQQVDTIGRSHVQVDVLQVEQDGEEQRPLQVSRLLNTNRTFPDDQTHRRGWKQQMLDLNHS